MKIGDTLWYRVGYRGEWRSKEINGETKLSWLVGETWQQEKINKKTMVSTDRQGATRWYTAEQKTDKIWIDANRPRIARAVELCNDRALLEAFERMLKP